MATDLDPEPNPDSGALDAERARLIGSIYEVVLSPDHFDSFMADWSVFVEEAARRLGELQVTDGQSARHLDDPVIEAHFRRAFALFERMGRGETVILPGEGPDPLLRLGRGGQVIESGPEAEALFGPAPGIAAIRAALDPDSAQRLSAVLAAQDRAPASGRFAVLSLAGATGQGSGLPGGGLLALATGRDASGEGFVTSLRPMAIGWSRALDDLLTASFRLTPREGDLVRDLVQGGDLAGIAASSGKSLNTLKAQLKSVFAKTRTSSQSELMRLVAVLVLHGPDTGRAAEPLRPGAGERLLDLGDGRLMPVQVQGPEGGVPVIFVHGMLEGLASLSRVDAALAAAGIRLYAPMRANFGTALADPRLREAPDLFARDLGRALPLLGLGRVVLLGHMAGTIYAHAAAARLEQVAGVATVAGCVPILSTLQFAAMTPRQRAVAYTARFAPALLPAILRAGMAQIDSRSAENFMMPLYAKGSRDREAIERLGIAETILDGYRYTVAQGPKAFHIDAWHVTRNWSALVDAGSCPVHMIHGTDDPVVTLDSVRAFAAMRNRVTLHELDGEGQLILYSRPESVLAEVARFARRCLAG